MNNQNLDVLDVQEIKIDVQKLQKDSKIKTEVLNELKKIKDPDSTVYNKDYWNKNLKWTHQNL